MRDETCIFCKIIADEIPSYTIYEDEEFRVILDVNPASKGHALILPKEHYANIYEIEEELAGRAMRLAKKLAVHMTKVLACDGFNLLQNNHQTAGQTVFHFHMHLIPRYKNAKNSDILIWNHENFTPEEMEEVKNALKCSRDSEQG
ncbi:MAG: HIT family protein [Clostridiales bacterium]|nr:HIT family protein [Clostridiales bacterium]